MKLSNKELQVLKHIVKHCDDMNLAIETFGDNINIFKENVVYKNAVSMPIMQIGELIKQLSSEFRAEYSEIPWKDYAGMRDWFAHKYQKMDVNEIWYTAKNDIPVLYDYCANLLKNFSDDE